MPITLISLLSVAGVTSPVASRFPEAETQLKQIYALVKERYVYPKHLYPERDPAIKMTLNEEDIWRIGNWDDVRDFYLSEVKKAKTQADADAALKGMVSWLRDDHSQYIDKVRAQEITRQYGRTLPCLPAPTLQANLFSPRSLEARMDGKVGIVVLPDIVGFDRTLAMRETLLKLKNQGAKAFVIDVRGNPGGQLVDMTGLAGLFQKGVLWRLKIRGWLFPLPIPAIGPADFKEPLAIVIDHDVNSAAEGFSGGLQTVGRAKIFGETSAGNVEAVYPYCLKNDSMVMLASGQLSPWTGPGWEGKGVVPDGIGGINEAIVWAKSQIR
ncbi:MAG: S41 family peptidase [Deinococcaceae bacterium]